VEASRRPGDGLDESSGAVLRKAWWIALAGVVALLGWNLGGHGLWDPWETHYAEVARQILVRGDPINLWWQPGEGPDGLSERRFFSKPALSFWLMALSLRAFGVGAGPDPHELVHGPWAEIAVRLPAVALACTTCWVLGRTVRRFVGDRAGLLTLLVCATLPQFAMIGRQALTDMPMVATMTWGLCAIAIAELDPESERELPRWKLGPLAVPASAWVVWCALLIGAGALIPVVVMTWLSREWIQMLPYHVALVLVVVAIGRARRVRELAWVVAHASIGLSFLAKGFLGPGLVAAALLVFGLVEGRLALLARHGLFGAGPLAFACTAMPWYHAMLVRKGMRFVGSILLEHQLRRFSSGEQQQAVGGATFYLRTLGLGAFPWVSLLPGALQRLWPDRSTGRPDTTFRRLVLCWLVVGFGVIAFSTTKYHHYLLPIMPAVAVAVSIVLADPPKRHVRACAVAGLVVWALVAQDLVFQPAGLAHLCAYLHTSPWNELPVDPMLVPLCSLPCAAALAAWLWRPTARAAPAGMLLAGIAVCVVALHRYVPQASEVWSQRGLHEALARARSETPSSDDLLIAWRLSYRGETFYSKGCVWVSMDGDPDALRAELDRGGAHARHVITAPGYVDQIAAAAPAWTVRTLETTTGRVLLELTP
jgi:4-amino-4-deoxy-L-arabinose transferase-like glycosyltransferase